MEQKFENQCQSCGMPLEKGEKSGTEADGSKSTMYCHYCYKDGAFCDPDMTLEQMKVVVDDNMKEDKMNIMMRWLAKMQLPSLKRWKK
jgi:hypothetical protein